MTALDPPFDVLVVGSGATGGIAVIKELTERRSKVLLVKAGRDISDEDCRLPPQPAAPRPTGIGVGRA